MLWCVPEPGGGESDDAGVLGGGILEGVSVIDGLMDYKDRLGVVVLGLVRKCKGDEWVCRTYWIIWMVVMMLALSFEGGPRSSVFGGEEWECIVCIREGLCRDC